MRRLDDAPMDPEIAEALDAIDATLAGEPVDPRHAELAELAVLLAADRPVMEDGFALELEARVQRRFSPPPEPPDRGRAHSRPRLAWRFGPVAGLASAAVAGVVAVVVLSSSGGAGTRLSATTQLPATAAVPAPARTAKAPGPNGIADQTAAASSRAGLPAIVNSPAPTPLGSILPDVVQPPANGRKVIQGAQLALSTAPNRVDDVAQQVFNVIGAENGVVNRSQVTATGGSDGYAEFTLSVPSGNLAQTMAQLSRLRYAHVASRTDSTQDVNDHYQSLQHQLADAQALRASLLKQLANASTQQQVDSLNAQLHDAEAKIAALQGELRFLGRQIALSQISLTINASALPVAHHGSSGFTIGRAARDAGRVLTVAAGVALIALAALVPVGLLATLGWWIAVTVRRRRREQALDLA